MVLVTQRAIRQADGKQRRHAAAAHTRAHGRADIRTRFQGQRWERLVQAQVTLCEVVRVCDVS
jgi:hypothetical protein